MKKTKRLNLIWLIPLWIIVGIFVHLFNLAEEIGEGIMNEWKGEL